MSKTNMRFTTEDGTEFLLECDSPRLDKKKLKKLYKAYGKKIRQMATSALEDAEMGELMSTIIPKLTVKQGNVKIEFTLEPQETSDFGTFISSCLTTIFNTQQVPFEQLIIAQGVNTQLDIGERQAIDVELDAEKSKNESNK